MIVSKLASTLSTYSTEACVCGGIPEAYVIVNWGGTDLKREEWSFIGGGIKDLFPFL